MAITNAQIQQLYVAYLGRAADKAGLDYWSQQLNATNATLTLDSLRANFVTSQPEYAAIYGGLDRSAQVTKIYENLFNRAPDAAGLTYWTTGGGSTVTPDLLLTAFINGAAATDATAVSNKVFVAQTYTDTAGTSYNATAGAQVITNVSSDPATVSAAVDTITNGTLPGGIPALNLIQALGTANAAVETFAKATATASATASLDANKDGSVSFAEANGALTDAQAARALPANGGTATIATLEANVSNANGDLTTAKAAATAQDGGAAAIAAYDAAVTADNAADAAVAANAASAAAASAGLNTAINASGSTVNFASLSAAAKVGVAFTTVAQVSTFLADPASNAADRAALVTELNKVATYGSDFVKAGDLALAAAKTEATLTTTKATLVAIDSDTGAAGSEGQDYIDAQAGLKAATDTLANAKTADAKVAAVKAVVDQYTALNKAATDAGDAITKFETANTSKIDIHGLTAGAVSETADNTKSDVFFFTSKLNTANDGAIANFGKGDSIVIGSTLTFNSGALSTGDNNKAEFFLVQKGSDTLVVLETAAYGSSTTTHTATGDAALTPADSPDAAVITLTGVNVADLSVSNGVISHVA